MKKLTRRQAVFLSVYPLAHLAAGSLLLFALTRYFDVWPPDRELALPAGKRIAVRAMGVALDVLWAPANLALLAGLPRSLFSGALGYLWLALSGLVYSFAMVFGYKMARRR